MNTATQTAATPLVFVQLNKIDEAQRLVYGRAVQEVPDRVGEIFDYASSKPLFEAWSKSTMDASMGKSSGNIRAMHKDVAAGRLEPVNGLTFHDGDKAIDIVAKIVDDAEWDKVMQGVYTGFSIGGSYAKKWEDTELKKTRYTANPTEISLVDRPCVPTATFFEIQKADGSVEKRDFAPAHVEAEEGSYDIQATPDEVEEFCKLLATSGVTFQTVLDSLKKEAVVGADKERAAAEAAAEVAAADAAAGKKKAKVSDSAVDTEAEEAAETPEHEAAETPAQEAAEVASGVDEAEKAKKSKKADGVTDLKKADLSSVQTAHDALCKAGAMCSSDNCGKVEPLGDLKKLAQERDDLKKVLDTVNEELKKLQADVTMLKAQPLPPTVRLRAVGKGEDLGEDKIEKGVPPVKDALGNVSDAATAIKKAHQTGGRSLLF